MELIRMPCCGVASWKDAECDIAATDESRAALAYFRSLLGDNWAGWRDSAPLASCFSTAFQGGDREWVRLHKLTRLLGGVVGTDSLVRAELGSREWTQYYAAVMTLEFCGRLRATGRRVELIERADLTNPADAYVELVDRVVLVELKALHDSAEATDWNDFMDWCIEQLLTRGKSIGSVEVDCEEPARIHCDEFLEGLVTVCDQDSDDWFDLPLGTGQARRTPSNTGCWHLPCRQKPDLERIAQKLFRSWGKKFRNIEAPSLLVVRTRSLFGATESALIQKPTELMAALKQAMAPHAGLGGILIYDERLNSPTTGQLLNFGNCRFCVDSRDGCARCIAIVPNERASNPLTDDELRTLVQHPMLW